MDVFFILALEKEVGGGAYSVLKKGGVPCFKILQLPIPCKKINAGYHISVMKLDPPYENHVTRTSQSKDLRVWATPTHLWQTVQQLFRGLPLFMEG